MATYLRLLSELEQLGLSIYGVGEWLKNSPKEGVLLRHDVDRRPLNALRMAQEEAQRGTRATYYFRVIGSSYNRNIIRKISELGHEVGYHYEDYSRAKGNLAHALKNFDWNLESLRGIVPIETIAMHGSPTSRFNNLVIGKSINMSSYQLLGDAIVSIDYSQMSYWTDTGRSWRASRSNLRDRPETSRKTNANIRSTNQLINYVRRTKPRRLALSVHPERWNFNFGMWFYQLLVDSTANGVKMVIHKTRRDHEVISHHYGDL